MTDFSDNSRLVSVRVLLLKVQGALEADEDADAADLHAQLHRGDAEAEEAQPVPIG